MATPAIPPEPTAPVSSVGRIPGVIFSPKPTFESIVERPTWILPLILLCVVSVTVVFVFGQRVGWRGFMERQNQTNARLQKQMESMTPDEREKMLETQTKYAAVFGYVGVVFVTFIGALLVAAVLLAAFNVIGGGKIGFTTSLGIVAHAWVPGIIAGLLGILIIFLKDPSTVDIQHLVATNAGAFLSDDAPKWQESLLSSLDLFVFWYLILMSIGYSATNPKKISFGKAFGTVVGVWLLYVIVKVGFTAAFS
jgi:hypothetical protein